MITVQVNGAELVFTIIGEEVFYSSFQYEVHIYF